MVRHAQHCTHKGVYCEETITALVLETAEVPTILTGIGLYKSLTSPPGGEDIVVVVCVCLSVTVVASIPGTLLAKVCTHSGANVRTLHVHVYQHTL